jgi:hypothetical protein
MSTLGQKVDAVTSLVEHKAKEAEHHVKGSGDTATMKDPKAPIGERAKATANAAGHSVAEKWHHMAGGRDEDAIKR